MVAARAKVARNEVMDGLIQPLDVLVTGESLSSNSPSLVATTGATDSLPASAIATGLVRRTGPTGNYADVWDTAANIVAALAGNAYAPETILGNSYRLLVINTVAFTATPTFGAGVVVGVGTTSQIASAWREYLIGIANVQPVSAIQCNTTNGSKTVTFAFSAGSGVVAHKIGPNASVFCTTGATVTGTGIPAGTTVTSVTQGQGGMTGCTISANATADGTNVALTFGPTITVDSLRSGPL